MWGHCDLLPLTTKIKTTQNTFPGVERWMAYGSAEWWNKIAGCLGYSEVPEKLKSSTVSCIVDFKQVREHFVYTSATSLPL